MGLFEKDGQNVGPAVSPVERQYGGGSGPLFTGDGTSVTGGAQDRYVESATYDQTTETLTLHVENGVDVDVVIPEGSTPESIFAHFRDSANITFTRDTNGFVTANIISGTISIDELDTALQNLINDKLTGSQAPNLAATGADQYPNASTVQAGLDLKQDTLTADQLAVVNANPFTTADEMKLDGIEAGADVTPSDVARAQSVAVTRTAGATETISVSASGALGLVLDTLTHGTDGRGWTGGMYDANTGIVTFTSDDGLGFMTGDLRGAMGAQGPIATFGMPVAVSVAAGGTPTANISGTGTVADPYILELGLVQGDAGSSYSDAQARTAVDFDVSLTDNVLRIQGVADGDTAATVQEVNLGTVAQSLTTIDVNISPIEDAGGTTVAVASTRPGGTGRTTLVLDRIPTRLPNRGSTITDQATAGGNEWNVHFAVHYTDLEGVEHAEITIDNPPATPAVGTNLWFDANQEHPVVSLIEGHNIDFALDARGDLTISAVGGPDDHHPHADIRIRANPNEVVTPIAADTNVTITVSGVGEEGATVTNLAITEITATGGLTITGTGLTRTLTIPAGHTNNVVVTAMVTYTFDDGSGNDEMVGPIAETVTVHLDAAWAFGFNAGVPTAFSDLNAQGPFRSPERVTNLTQPAGEDFYFALPSGTGTPSVQDGALFLEVLQVTGFTGYDVYEVAEVTTGSNIVIEV